MILFYLMFTNWQFDNDDVAGSGGFHAHKLPIIEGSANHYLRSIWPNMFKRSICLERFKKHKNAVKLSAAGLVVNGQTHPGASAAKPKKTQSSNEMTKSEPAKSEPKEK